ncbi:MAG TPA: 2-oxoglutarate dehydrogenase complex dihydrolipoyllysine-residue succinyltransferase [Steroidobacteraceae bacterium]|jgi:2-oxoglutarate dehydrogenase E2 component (dihydrolipoamide succinyltransferase)|nr:2-oxoglutarate dehydrogenase complex dihydrolipoyllysine-residue succinyltransferase [Steroidobacteraceae bacterium]
MTIEVRVPQLPESVADATLVSWHKKPGDSVVRDENLVDLETDKVVLEVPAPAAGVIKEIKLADGTTVTSGQLLAVIDETATAAAVPGASAPAILAASSGATAAAADTVAKDASAKESATPEAGGKLSPAAKRVAEENKVDPKAVAGSGRDGRVSKSDIVNYLSTKETAAASPASAPGAAAAAPPSAAAKAAPAQFVPAPSARGSRGEQHVPMTRLRARIAERMVQAQATQALLTSFNEVDLQAVNELRARYKDQFEKQYGVKLGFMSFFAKACVEALKKFPSVNASVDGNDIVYHEFFDIGVAVSTDRGLIVPVLRDVDQLSFADIEKSIANFASRARAGSITIEELTGGTFTITNGGVFGSLMSTPIVNSPQSAILGMHKIQDRPVVVDGQIVVRPMMYIALTYDHRIIDGREAVQFLVTVKQCLEDPARMVLHI